MVLTVEHVRTDSAPPAADLLAGSLTKLARTLTNQARSLSSLLIRLYVPLLILFLVLIYIRIRVGLPFEIFTRDPLAVFDAQPYVGLLSNLGVILWAAGAGICLFSWSLLRSRARPETIRPFLQFGLLTAWVCLDDLFLFHEEVLPEMIGLPEEVFLGACGLIAVVFTWRARRWILETEPLLFILAVAFLGLSAVADTLPDLGSSFILPGQYLIEDGAKLAGILTWLAYWIKSSRMFLGPLLKVGRRPDSPPTT